MVHGISPKSYRPMNRVEIPSTGYFDPEVAVFFRKKNKPGRIGTPRTGERGYELARRKANPEFLPFRRRNPPREVLFSSSAPRKGKGGILSADSFTDFRPPVRPQWPPGNGIRMKIQGLTYLPQNLFWPLLPLSSVLSLFR